MEIPVFCRKVLFVDTIFFQILQMQYDSMSFVIIHLLSVGNDRKRGNYDRDHTGGKMG